MGYTISIFLSIIVALKKRNIFDCSKRSTEYMNEKIFRFKIFIFYFYHSSGKLFRRKSAFVLCLFDKKKVGLGSEQTKG